MNESARVFSDTVDRTVSRPLIECRTEVSFSGRVFQLLSGLGLLPAFGAAAVISFFAWRYFPSLRAPRTPTLTFSEPEAEHIRWDHGVHLVERMEVSKKAENEEMIEKVKASLSNLREDWELAWDELPEDHPARGDIYEQTMMNSHPKKGQLHSISEILPGIYLGGQESDHISRLELQRKEGRFILSYMEAKHSEDFQFGGVVNCDRQAVGNPGAVDPTFYLSSIYQDCSESHFNETTLARALCYLDTKYEHNHTVIVHSGAGVKRAPAVLALWLALRLNLDIDQVYRFIRSKRLVIAKGRDNEYLTFCKRHLAALRASR